MRQIAVSVEIFAKIWALREAGEETENDILARLLTQAPTQKVENYSEAQASPGFRDLRHGVLFPEGFEIFRSLKGEDVRARASGGRWVLKGSGALYGSLNELSRGVGAGTENAWASWFFLGPDGRRQHISTLRDPTAVVRRKARPAGPLSEDALWLADVRAGLAAIEDGRGLLDDIYKAVEQVRRAQGRDWPVAAKATVLRILEESSSDSDAFKGGADHFAMPYGKGAGFWALR